MIRMCNGKRLIEIANNNKSISIHLKNVISPMLDYEFKSEPIGCTSKVGDKVHHCIIIK